MLAQVKLASSVGGTPPFCWKKPHWSICCEPVVVVSAKAFLAGRFVFGSKNLLLPPLVLHANFVHVPVLFASTSALKPQALVLQSYEYSLQSKGWNVGALVGALEVGSLVGARVGARVGAPVVGAAVVPHVATAQLSPFLLIVPVPVAQMKALSGVFAQVKLASSVGGTSSFCWKKPHWEIRCEPVVVVSAKAPLDGMSVIGTKDLSASLLFLQTNCVHVPVLFSSTVTADPHAPVLQS